MKRVGNIFESMCDIENIKAAIQDAARYKTKRKSVMKVMANIDYYALEIQRLLVFKIYEPSKYTEFKIVERSANKERLITKTNFYPDQVIHWLLINAIKPIIQRGMYMYSCGSVPGKGPLYASDILKSKMRKDPKNTKYCLKVDIKHYYENIDHTLLKAKFRRVIKDADVLWLIDTIIDSYPKGLPIGTYTSQWFANFFLQDVDHYLKEDLGVSYMVRYMDDIVILGGNKRKLHKVREALDAFLANKKLELKKNWQVFRIASKDGKYKGRAVDFAGYKLYKDCRTIRRRIFKRLRRNILRIVKKIMLKRARTFMSYYGFIKHSDSARIIEKYFSLIKIKKIRECISQGG